MRASRTYGSVRGAPSNGRSYRDRCHPWRRNAQRPSGRHGPVFDADGSSDEHKTLRLCTGICLVNQRDPIQTAKLVASIDQLSGGRFLFGIGNGWHEEEMRNHGTVLATRHQLVRERVEAMRAIWTQDRAEYQGAFVNFGPMLAKPQAHSEAVSAGHRRGAHIPTLPAAPFSMATVGMH
jgi:Luciferase-like monooxygenase